MEVAKGEYGYASGKASSDKASIAEKKKKERKKQRTCEPRQTELIHLPRLDCWLSFSELDSLRISYNVEALVR